MKVANRDVPALARALTLLSADPPANHVLAIAQLRRRVQQQASDIEAARIGLLRRFGQPHENGDLRVPTGDDHWPEFQKAFEDVMSAAFEVPALCSYDRLLHETGDRKPDGWGDIVFGLLPVLDGVDE